MGRIRAKFESFKHPNPWLTSIHDSVESALRDSFTYSWVHILHTSLSPSCSYSFSLGWQQSHYLIFYCSIIKHLLLIAPLLFISSLIYYVHATHVLKFIPIVVQMPYRRQNSFQRARQLRRGTNRWHGTEICHTSFAVILLKVGFFFAFRRDFLHWEQEISNKAHVVQVRIRLSFVQTVWELLINIVAWFSPSISRKWNGVVP